MPETLPLVLKSENELVSNALPFWIFLCEIPGDALQWANFEIEFY